VGARATGGWTGDDADTSLTHSFIKSIAALPSVSSYSIFLDGKGASELRAHVLRAKDANLIQPFGALGGMPALTQLVMAQLTMGRLPPAYVFQSMQNAQLLVCVTDASVEAPEADPALNSIVVGHALDATDAAPVVGYTEALQEHVGDALPAWRTTTPSGGTYGVLYHRNFEHEYALQQRARAVEDAYFKRLQPAAGAPVYTHWVGLCTLTVEQCSAPSYMRFLTNAEVRAGVAWSVKAWEKEISTELRSRVPVCLAGTEEAALSHALLEARAQQEQVAMASRQASALETMGTLFQPAATVSETVVLHRFLHISAVVGHPGSPGAGSRALDEACKLADTNRMPLVLEALPNRLLFAYYARWGFRAVVWLGARADVPRNFNPKVSILMYRAPKPVEPVAEEETEEPQAVAAQAADLDLRDFLSKLRFAESEDGRALTTELLRRPFSIPRADIRPEALHLSVAAETAVWPLFVWNRVGSSSDMYVDGAYSWAREYARQVRAGDWDALQPLRIPLPDPVPALPATATAPVAQPPPLPPTQAPATTTLPVRRVATATTTATQMDENSGEDIVRPPPAQRARLALVEKSIQTSPLRPACAPAASAPAASWGVPFNLIFNVQAGGVVYVNYPPPQLVQPVASASAPIIF